MTLPGNLKSEYKEYKKDTDAVASWLASTAKLCGYKSGMWSDAPKSRAKGKRKQDGNGKDSETNNDGPVYKRIIAIGDYVPMAEFISASRKPVIGVPECLMNTLDRVICVRARFGAKMAKYGHQETVEGANNHDYFVGVLKAVRAVLLPGTVKTSAGAPTQHEELSNVFNRLELHEPSQKFLSTPAIDRPENAANGKVVYVAERQKSWREIMLEFSLMMNDLTDIRKQIMEMWFLVVTLCRDIASVAVTINAAIDLARHIMEDAVPIFKGYGGPLAVCQKYEAMFIESRARHRAENEHTKRSDPWVKLGYSMYDVGNHCFVNCGQIISELAGIPVSDKHAGYRKGVQALYDPMYTTSRYNIQQMFAEDKAIISQLWPEAMTIALHVPDYPVEDEFIRGLKELQETGKIPFMLIFAGQVILDIHHTAGKNGGIDLDTLLFQFGMMKAPLDFFLKGNPTNVNWTATKEAELREFLVSVNVFLEDHVFQAKKRLAMKENDLDQFGQTHMILKYNPLLAGLVLFHFRAGMFEVSLSVVNAYSTVTIPVHLYNAIKQEKMTSKRWWDLEIMIYALGESKFFSAGKPTRHNKLYFNRYAVQMGVSASNWAPRTRYRTRNQHKSPEEMHAGYDDLFSRAGMRKIENVAPVTSKFMDRYWRNSHTANINWTPEHIIEVISYSEYETYEDKTTFKAIRIQDVAKLRERRRRRERPSAGRKGADQGGQVHPVSVLKSLLSALQSEAVEFNFGYLTMQKTTQVIMTPLVYSYRPSIFDRMRMEDDIGGARYATASILRSAQGLLGCDSMGPLSAAAKAFEHPFDHSGCGVTYLLKRSLPCWIEARIGGAYDKPEHAGRIVHVYNNIDVGSRNLFGPGETLKFEIKETVAE